MTREALDVVLARLRDDPAFADAVRSDPAGALSGAELDESELRRIERVVHGTVRIDDFVD